MKKLLAIGILAIGGNLLWAGGLMSSASASSKPSATNSAPSDPKTIAAPGDQIGGLDQTPPTNCPAGVGAYFVITQIEAPNPAPEEITVNFSDGSSTSYPFQVQDGKTAKYFSSVAIPSGTSVTGASATIYASWSGTFNLSHYYCASDNTPSSSVPPSSVPPSSVPSPTVPPSSVPPSSVPSPTVPPSTVASSTSTTLKHHDGGTTTTTAAHNSAGNGSTTTTTAKPTTSTTTKVTKATVADNTTTTVAKATPTTPATAHSGLAFTGSRTGLLLSWALGLLLMGGILVLSARRVATKKS